MRRFCLGLTGHVADADDLLQAGCERALSKREQWAPGTRMDSWMYRILQNLWIDHTRKPAAEPLDDAAHARLADDAADAQLSQVSLDQALAAMQSLSPDARLIMTCVCIEGLSYKETADVAQVPIGTVMSRLARARKTVADQLGELGSAA